MKSINYLFEKANGLTIFFAFGTMSALTFYVILYSLIVTDATTKITNFDNLVISFIFGVLGGLLLLTSILATRKSTKFWDYAETVEKLIDAADSKELLEHIHKGEFEILRSLCMGGPQATELNRLFTIMKTKYKYVK